MLGILLGFGGFSVEGSSVVVRQRSGMFGMVLVLDVTHLRIRCISFPTQIADSPEGFRCHRGGTRRNCMAKGQKGHGG